MVIRPRKTFLLVEDDLNDAKLVQMEFNHQPGVQLNWVADGEQAIQYLLGQPPFKERAAFPLPHVIILDLKMPRMTGFDFLQWLQKEAPEQLRLIPVIVMSGSNLQQDIVRAYQLGANCYLTKPPDWKKFREQLLRIGIFWGELVETPELSGY